MFSFQNVVPDAGSDSSNQFQQHNGDKTKNEKSSDLRPIHLSFASDIGTTTASTKSTLAMFGSKITLIYSGVFALAQTR